MIILQVLFIHVIWNETFSLSVVSLMCSEVQCLEFVVLAMESICFEHLEDLEFG